MRWLFDALLENLQPALTALQRNAEAVAQLDVLATFAERADVLKYVAPQFSNEAGLDVVDGLHQVVEQLAQPFIANSVSLTFYGLSLAWAVARQLLEKSRSYTLFATHYFELTRISEEFKHAANVHLDAVEHGNGIVFLHNVEEGPASQSYGLQVAQLAGIPRSVVNAAKRKLVQLEQSQVMQQYSSGQGDMFVAVDSAPEPAMHQAVSELESIDPDGLTPRQALDVLYKLKKLI